MNKTILRAEKYRESLEYILTVITTYGLCADESKLSNKKYRNRLIKTIVSDATGIDYTGMNVKYAVKDFMRAIRLLGYSNLRATPARRINRL